MSTDFEHFISLKTRLRDEALKRQQKYHDQYMQSVSENAPERKISVYQKLESDAIRSMNFHEAEINIARPEIQSDVEERLRIIKTYPNLIKSSVSKDNPLFFHGVNSITFLNDILSSGHLGYLENEETLSFTSPGTVDVTTADSIATSIENFTGLNCGNQNRFLPAGCLFVIAPEDDKEKAYANHHIGSEHNISTVNFKQNPDRIVAIVSTNENKDRILELAERYHIDSGKIHTFDSFIEALNTQEKSRIQQANDVSISDNSPSKRLRELRGISSVPKAPYKPKEITINPNTLRLYQIKKTK